MNNFMTADQIAEHLNISKLTVDDWRRRGLIPARRLSERVIRYTLADVVAALESRQAAKEENSCRR